jgi:hypothetical protein
MSTHANSPYFCVLITRKQLCFLTNSLRKTCQALARSLARPVSKYPINETELAAIDVKGEPMFSLSRDHDVLRRELRRLEWTPFKSRTFQSEHLPWGGIHDIARPIGGIGSCLVERSGLENFKPGHDLSQSPDWKSPTWAELTQHDFTAVAASFIRRQFTGNQDLAGGHNPIDRTMRA